MERINFLLLREKYGDYYRWQDKTNPSFNKDLASEADKRIRQLHIIINEIYSLEEHLIKPSVFNAEGIPNDINQSRFIEQLELYAESFYYFAFRLRSIIRHLPDLKKFEAEGIRDVRNQLIEHPEGKDSQVFIVSFAFGRENGPVLKAARYSNQIEIYPDKGLYKNAEEFYNNLDSCLDLVINKGKKA